MNLKLKNVSHRVLIVGLVGGWLVMNLRVDSVAGESWTLESEKDWKEQIESSKGIVFQNGEAASVGDKGSLRTNVKTFPEKRTFSSLTVSQSPVWQNWIAVDNIGPSNLKDAPVLLTKGPKDYWIFGRYGRSRSGGKKGGESNRKQDFKSKPAVLEGFDIPLQTTKFPNQFDAPGGLKPGRGGYHAWQSRDMKNWVHHGPVTEKFSAWVTSAEMIDDKVLIYYDFPNDQDPHVYVDHDLTDGLPGQNMGIAVRDPSHGSDAGFIRDLEGKMHVIIEDWTPISANRRSWDSPLAGHAVSPDGIDNFVFKMPAVDARTKATGEIKTYTHPHWAKEDPENYKTNVAEYEVHEPEQEAYGDWAAICIGGQYYLFADYDPVGAHQMSVCWFTSPSIDEPFTWCDHIGKGHPDPDICFAEGRLFLVTQQQTDFSSPGPWVETVEARVGVDTDGDQGIDHWGEWSEVRESYDYIPGFAKQVKRIPARADLSGLPPGFGFQIELKLTDSTENKSKPIIDRITLQ